MARHRKGSTTGRQCQCRKGYSSEYDGKCNNCRTKAERRDFDAYHREQSSERGVRREDLQVTLSHTLSAVGKTYTNPERVFLEPRAASVIHPTPEVVKPMKIYAGIGSRETPPEVIEWMETLGEQLALAGWTLRSGFADGADNAFARGAEAGNGAMELYVPWTGFNDAPIDHPAIICTQDLPLAIQYHMHDIAEAFHPNWSACSPAAKKLHARNVPQIIGSDLNTAVSCVICWTPGGKHGGGTGQAIRIAKNLKIPIFDLFNERDRELLVTFVNNI